MTKQQITILSIFSITFLLVACPSPTIPLVEPPKLEPSSPGASLTITIDGAGNGGGASRTIVPGNLGGLISKYSVLLASSAESRTVTSTSSPIVVSGLAPGNWSVAVTGLDANSKLLAQGETAITVGTDLAVTAAVALKFIQNGGTGAITLTFTFPHAVGITAVEATLDDTTIAPAPSISALDASTDTVVISVPTVPAGSPLLRIFFKKDTLVMAGVMENVWVFQNITTTATIALSSTDFGAPPAGPSGGSLVFQHDGSSLLSWTNNSYVADSYIVRRADGIGSTNFVQIGPELPYNATSFVDSSNLLPSFFYAYRIYAKNRFGESAPLSGIQGTTNAVVATPNLSPYATVPVAIREIDTIAMSTTTGGSTIYYTMSTDGSEPETPSAASIRYTGPVSLALGSATVKIKAIAARSDMRDSGIVEATYAVNRKPIISSFTANASTGLHSTTFVLTVTATDPEGSGLNYSYQISQGAGTVTNTSQNTTNAKFSMEGTNIVTVTVTDGVSNTATATCSVVIAANRSPVVSSMTLAAGTIYNNGTDTKLVTVVATDPDGDALSYTYQIGTGPGAVFGNGSTAMFQAGLLGGSSTVRVTVNDGYGRTATRTSTAIKTCGWLQPVTTMESRIAPAIFYSTLDGYIQLFGGQSTGTGIYNNDMWFFFPPNSWSIIDSNQAPSATRPSARSRHTMVMVDTALYTGIMFGGYDGGAILADIWRYEGVWSQLAPTGVAPPPMDLVNAVSNGAGISYILGSDGLLYMLYVPVQGNLYPVKWENVSAAALPQRTGYSAVYDGTGVVVFGGLNGGTTYLNDVWKYTIGLGSNPGTWTQLSSGGSGSTVPSPRYGQAAAYVSGNMYIFGGNANGTAMNDIWRFNIATATWTQLTSNGPSGRYFHKLAYYNGSLYSFGTTLADPILWQYILP